MTLRIWQYVSFSLFSSSTTADEMTELIGMPPDNIFVRGSRRLNPPIPRQHKWTVTCDDRGSTVDEQLDALIARLQPYQDAIRRIVDDLAVNEGASSGARLDVVRHFDDARGEAGDYQHQLLGWGLSEQVVRFALDMRTGIEVDEYGQDRARDYLRDPRSMRLGVRRAGGQLGSFVRELAARGPRQ